MHHFQLMCGDTHIALTQGKNAPQLDMLLLGLHVDNAAVFPVSTEVSGPRNALHDAFMLEVRQRGLKSFPLLGTIPEPVAAEPDGTWHPWVMLLGLEPVAAYTLANRYQKRHVFVYKFGFTLENLPLRGDLTR